MTQSSGAVTHNRQSVMLYLPGELMVLYDHLETLRPKGPQEMDELLDEAAVREVAELCDAEMRAAESKWMQDRGIVGLVVAGSVGRHAQNFLDEFQSYQPHRSVFYRELAELFDVAIERNRARMTGLARERRGQSLPGGSSNAVHDTCFVRLCVELGIVSVRSDTTSASQLSAVELAQLRSINDVKIIYCLHDSDERSNHIEKVDASCRTATLSPSGGHGWLSQYSEIAITTPVQLANPSTHIFCANFYSRPGAESPALAEFGALASAMTDGSTQQPADAPASAVDGAAPVQGRPGAVGSGRGGGTRAEPSPAATPRAASVVDEGFGGGASNLSGGVVRPARRVLKAKVTPGYDRHLSKAYVASGGVQFNNISEMMLDSLSPEAAQELVDEVFGLWRVPFDQPNALKFSEDLLKSFLLSRTASNKADYEAVFAVPVQPMMLDGELVEQLDVDMGLFSRLLAERGTTRRRFARGYADQLRRFLREPENAGLIVTMAARVGADPQYGDLAFDGSAACSDLSTAQATFARTLASRNLYEAEDVLAHGASHNIMKGFSGTEPHSQR